MSNNFVRVERVYVGSDHGGYALKQKLFPRLTEVFPDIEFVDLGCNSAESVDYPDYSALVAKKVKTPSDKGLLICGSGIGIQIAANKFPGIRAATIWDATSARLSREHNDANIICLGGRLIGEEVAFEAVKVFITTAFQGGRHQKRVDLITKLEETC